MRKFSIKRSFGVELEISNIGQYIETKNCFNVKIDYIREIVSNNTIKKVVSSNEWSQSVNNDFWHIKYDATCGEFGKGQGLPRGWEVASFKASGYNDLLHIADMANVLAMYGLRVNSHCGLHIHIDVSDFDTDQVAILVARWIKAEYWMKQSVPKNRRNNKYCKFLTSKKKYELFKHYDPNNFWKIIKPTNFNPHENSQKKVALNLVNYTAFKESYFSLDLRPTIELRLPEGTLDGNDIINWVRLCLFFVEASKKSVMPLTLEPEIKITNALDFLGLNGTEAFKKETRNWFLNRIINMGQISFSKKVKKWLDVENEEKFDIS
jgi:hypothetical protein